MGLRGIAIGALALTLAAGPTRALEAGTVVLLSAEELIVHFPHEPLALTEDSFLVPLSIRLGDGDETLLVEAGSDGAWRTTRIPTPDLGWLSGLPLRRLSPTRALIPYSGRGLGYYLLDDLGGRNRVVDLGALGSGTELVLDEDTLVVRAEQGVVRLTRLGGELRTDRLADRSMWPLLALAPDRFLARDDEGTWVFGNVGRGAEAVEVPVGEPLDGYARLSPERVLASRGSDAFDDELALLRELGGAPAVDRTTVGWVSGFVPLASGIIVLRDPAGEGVRVLESLAPGSPIRRIRPACCFGAPGDPPPALAAAGSDRVAVGGPGPDRTLGTSDDELWVIGALAAESPTLDALRVGSWARYYSPLRALRGGLLRVPVRVDAWDDARVTWLADLAARPRVEHAPDPAPETRLYGAPAFLSGGRAVWTGWGRRGDTQDVVAHVVAGFDDLTELDVEKVRVHAGRRHERVRLRGTLRLEDPDVLARETFMIRVGGAVQTLPAGSFRETGDGYVYRDRGGRRGWIRRIRWERETGVLLLRGGGRETGAGDTDADNLIVSFDSLGVWVARSLNGASMGRSVVFPAPESFTP